MFREKVAKQVDWSQRFANEIYSICIHWYLKKRSYITVSRPWTKLKVVLVETHKLEMKGSIYFSNNQCKILYQDEYLFVCVVILHYRSNKCIQCPIWRQIQPIHCIHYIWRHWFWLANGYIRKPRVLSYVIKNSCRKVQQYSSWEKGIGLFIFIDLTKCAPQFETASRKILIIWLLDGSAWLWCQIWHYNIWTTSYPWPFLILWHFVFWLLGPLL